MENLKFECYIYCLICPVTNTVKYIGKTKQPLNKRLKAHLIERGNSRKCIWIRSLKNRIPMIKLLEVSNNLEWKEKENFWIEKHKKTILNQVKGGGGCVNKTKTYLDVYIKSVIQRKKKNTAKSYIHCVKKFLTHFDRLNRNPIDIKESRILEYLSGFENNNTRNLNLIALKDFYRCVINQHKKLNSVKYKY